jgi:hypothetical protein
MLSICDGQGVGGLEVCRAEEMGGSITSTSASSARITSADGGGNDGGGNDGGDADGGDADGGDGDGDGDEATGADCAESCVISSSPLVSGGASAAGNAMGDTSVVGR